MTAAEPVDARLAPVALGCWGAAALALGWSPARALLGAAALWVLGALAAVGARRQAGRWLPSLVLLVLVAGAAMASAGLRSEAVRAGPVASLAQTGGYVRITGQVSSDPELRQGSFGPYVLVHLSARTVTAAGATTGVRSPLLVIGDPGWTGVAFADQVSAAGHLQPASGPDLSAVLIATGPPTVTARAGWLYGAVAAVRHGLVTAARPLGASERGLLPALVDGDGSAMPEQTTAQFRASGLTHLLAVSGSNLTLVLAFVLWLARWLRVRGYGLALVGVGAVAFFVLLARPQPSVLRAAAMGVVALAGLSGGSRSRGLRVLCVAVAGLVLIDPWLARSVGFVLSTLASAAIVVLAPRWRDCLARWLPGWLAEAVAVPLAAQLACTPVIAAVSGQVSLVAVFANLAVAPAVGPATITSLLAGLVAMASQPVGQLAGRVAGVPLWWIVWVARRAAGADGAGIAWGADAISLVVLSVLCLILVLALPVLLPRRVPCLAATGLLVLAVLHPVGKPGWPPSGWVMVMCDVGQGDGLVLNAGGGNAVVVDAGPDPIPMRRCLRELGVRRIPLVVLTHFHADHVDGLPAVLAAAPVGELVTSPYDEPADRYRAVLGEARAAGVPVTPAVLGATIRVGQLVLRVIGPPPSTADGAGGDDGSAPNNASVVMVARVAGISILLGGDAETQEDDAILAEGAGLRVDVLKEPHHGSAALDPRFLAATHAAVSLISVGAGNPYGHPAPQTLSVLHRLHMAVYRTDQQGDLAVVAKQGRLLVVTSR